MVGVGWADAAVEVLEGETSYLESRVAGFTPQAGAVVGQVCTFYPFMLAVVPLHLPLAPCTSTLGANRHHRDENGLKTPRVADTRGWTCVWL